MFDSKKMFDLGLAFLNVGEVSFHEGAIKRRSDCQNVAGIVNLALSCELFIKCLLNMVEVKESGHRLEELWSKYQDRRMDEASKIKSTVMKRLDTDLTLKRCYTMTVMSLVSIDIFTNRIAWLRFAIIP